MHGESNEKIHDVLGNVGNKEFRHKPQLIACLR